MKNITIISPAYNEAESIMSFYKELKTELKKLVSYNFKILFVVDRSNDNTLEILKEIAVKDASVRIIALSSRFGHQMSLLAGMDNVDADAAIMMDSDLQHPPKLISQLIKEYENGHDVVYTIRQDTVKIGSLKRYTSKLFYRFFNLISDMPLQDGVADFRLISHKIIKIFQEQIRERNMFLRGLMGWVGFKQTAVNYVARERAAGKSKYSFSRLLRLGMLGTITFSKKPLRIATFTGIIFAFLGFIYAVITLFQYFIGGRLPSGWLTFIILLSVFSGVQLICLGIIGEYIGGIFDEVKKRPHYIIEEKVNF